MSFSTHNRGLPSLCDRFKSMLENNWTRSATSGKYKDTSKILEWMKSVEAGTKASNAELLLREVFERSQARTFPPTIESTGEDSCYLVLSALLEINNEELFDFFRELKITDKSLEHAHFHYGYLRKDLITAGFTDAKDIIDRFDAIRWSYLPPKFHLGFDERLHGGKWILPFCRREAITEKGGTAQLWQVAIQEDHVQKDLRRSIDPSRFWDETFGWCYCLAIKSYPEENSDIFRLEREAFLGLGSQKGMVQYLGSYSIDGCATQPGTHNILLEYGQFDLDEYFADKRSYPPITGAEIRFFWQSLFEIADAIRRLHYLKHEDKNGGTDEYHGWHADIKPDNILRINGEFKLADFGFAKFKRKSDEDPKSFIEGGTETYGSPERDSATFKKGERKTFSQTIDIWSFGCVLSISATWVVLGFQGVLQYGTLRRKAIGELKKRRARGEQVNIPTPDDSFHDGKTVLPEIFHWHDYLRTNKRHSDKVTERVLDLVDAHMLQEDPNKRHTSVKLCAKLEEILRMAQLDELSTISQGHIPKMHKTIKEALLEHEKGAFSDAVRAANGVNDNKMSPIVVKGKSPAALTVPQEHQPLLSKRTGSKRIGKFEKITEVPRGKTANRAQILEQELELSSDTSQASQTLNPFAITDIQMSESPIEATLGAFESSTAHNNFSPSSSVHRPSGQSSSPNAYSTSNQDVIIRRPRPVHADTIPNHWTPSGMQQEIGSETKSVVAKTPTIAVRAATIDNYQPAEFGHKATPKFEREVPAEADRGPHLDLSREYETRLQASATPPGHGYWPPADGSKNSLNNSPYPAPAASTTTRLHGQASSQDRFDKHAGMFSDNPVSHPSSYPVTTQFVSLPVTPYSTTTHPETSITPLLHQPISPTADSPSSPAERSVATPPLRTSPPPLPASRTASSPGREVSRGILSDENLPEVSAPKRVSTHKSGKIPVVETSDSYWPPGRMPNFVRDLDVYKTRRKLAEKWPTGIKLKFANYTRSFKKDSRLGVFIQDRDIMFLVDNGSSMGPHWEAVGYVLETLAMKLAGIDEDGLDLHFTLGGINVRNATDLTAPKKFIDAMALANPHHPDRGTIETDMSAKLGQIFDKYNPAKRMTLIVLTDGVWAKKEGVEEMIAGFIKKLSARKRAELRRFSIEFVRFGTDEVAKERLKWLDDNLHKKYAVEDIIDTVDWTGSVEKMILGSSHAGHDDEPDDEATIEELTNDRPVNRQRQSVDQRPSTSDRRSAIGRSGTVQSKSSRASQKFSQFWRGDY